MADEQKGEPPPKLAAKQDVETLQGQFDEQQQLIGQLRDALKSQQTSKPSVSGMEDYASRLAKMKPRLLRGRSTGLKKREPRKVIASPQASTRAVSEPQGKLDADLLQEAQQDLPQDSLPDQTPAASDNTEPATQSSSSSQASLEVLSIPDSPPVDLVKSSQIEMAEPQQPVDENPPTQSKIQLLRRKLEENRIKFERQQRENTNKRATMDDMKDRIDKLREEVEQRDHLIESLQDTGPADPNIHHLYQQILHKDNTIMELTDSVSHLELVIKDQTEQLSEKDQIIAARTEAVGLVSKDKEQKLLEALNEVETLRNSMKKAEKEFQIKEESWATLEKSLSSVIEEKSKKVKILEENYQRMENVRFELSTTNAEIQEKLVKVQTHCQDLNEALKLAEAQTRKEKEEIAELSKKVSRAEAFGQKKLKVFEKYFKGLDNQEVKEQISKLSNEIAMLEEEKGNLQLKLVDFDDLKEIENKHRQHIEKLQADVEALECSSKSQVSLITGLENAKIGLVDALNKKNLQCNEIEGQSNAYQGQIEQLKQDKVTLELKLCALEEERDTAIQKTQNMECQSELVPSFAHVIREQQLLNDQINQLKAYVQELEEKCIGYEEQINSQNDEFTTAIEIREQKLEENQCLIELLAEKESEITTQAIKIENTDILLRKLQQEIADKISAIKGHQEKIITLEGERENLREKVNSLQVLTGELETKNDELQMKLSSSDERINDLQKTCNKYKESILKQKKAQQKLEYQVEGALHDSSVKDANLQAKLKEILQLEQALAERSSETESIRQQYAQKCLEETKLQNDLENFKKEFQEEKSKMETELNLLGNMIKDKDNEVESLMREIEVKSMEISNNQEVISKFEENVCSKNLEVAELEKLKEQYDDDVTHLNVTIEKLEKEVAVKSQKLEEFIQLSTENDSSMKVLQEEVLSKSSQIEALQTSLEQFHLQQQETTHELQNTKSSSMEICELLQKEIDNKNNELISLQSVLHQETTSRDQKMQELEIFMSQKIQELQTLQKKLLDKEEELSQDKKHLAELNILMEKNTKLISGMESSLEQKDQKLVELQHHLDSQVAVNTEDTEDISVKLKTQIDQFQQQLTEAYSSISALQEKCNSLQNVCDEANTKKEAAMEQCYALQNQIQSMQVTIDAQTSPIIQESAQVTSASAFFDSLGEKKDKNDEKHSTNFQKEIEQLEKEKCSLEKELENARQAIIRLETSLATQSATIEEQTEGNWGVIDLGESALRDSSASMQTALSEKDKTLTVIQDQLKDALQQVNSAVDEKKLIEHQLKTLEVELEHKDNTVKKYMDELCSLKATIESNESEKEKVPKEASSWLTQHDCDQIEEVSKREQASAESLQKSNSMTEEAIIELQYKLSWYEEQWAAWTENYTQLQVSLQQEEMKRLSSEEESKIQQSILQEAEETIASMKEKHIQTEKESSTLKDINASLQEQVKQLERSLESASSEIANLKNLEKLQTEMKSLVQENTVKSEGSESRIQELELMVQSAESEISRLRSDMASLTAAGKSLETERTSLEEELTNLKEELRKNNCEKERIQSEYDRLQEQTAIQASVNLQMQESSQRSSALNEQLRSEIEVLEGDSGRMRINYEILEGECARLRDEVMVLTQSNQMLEAQCESMTTEVNRLTELATQLETQKNHLIIEKQEFVEVSTSKESEISRLKVNLGKYEELETEHQQLQTCLFELTAKCGILEEKLADSQNISVEEVDWGTEGKMEAEHLQTSSTKKDSAEFEDRCRAAEKQVKMLEEELDLSRNAQLHLREELNSAKKANAKMVQKVKANNLKLTNLQKEMSELKDKAGGFSDLDLAVEAEFKAQIEKAQSERDQLKITVGELEKEKISLCNQLDVFQNAEGKYIEMKESQDAALHCYSEKNKALEGQLSSLEWKISELEEIIEQQQSLNHGSSLNEGSTHDSDLQKQIDVLEEENTQFKSLNDHLRSSLEILQKDHDTLEQMKDKHQADAEKYKSSYLELYAEHQTLSEKDQGASHVQSTLEQELDMLKASYDALHYDYQASQVSQAAVDRDLSIAASENEKLKEEIESLQKQLSLLQEEEEEEIIVGLQGECESLRQTIGLLKDEIIELTENARQAQHENERTKRAMEKQIEIQDLLRDELSSKIGEVNFLNASVGTQENNLKYERAEIAALKAQVAKLSKNNIQLNDKLKISEEKLAAIQSENTTLTDLKESALLLTSEDKRRASESTEQTGLDASQVSVKLRDFRAQQMALEINKLVEERDALQLKLSSSLRRNQQLERELSMSQHLPASPPSSSLLVKLDELRELNSSLEEKAVRGMSTLPPTLPTFVSHTAPPTPTASRHKELSVSRETHGTSSTLVNWILGKSTPKEVLHV